MLTKRKTKWQTIKKAEYSMSKSGVNYEQKRSVL